ncbi:MAG: hypothetical protein J6C00_13025 [Eubacterium sp.]|nr:hypothetical protein [Eubacterium sp.]
MAALRWDEQSQAYVETTGAPKRYDPESEAWVETTGMVWDHATEAWTERWGQKVTAYVYGAALETVTIKKNGIIVATVETNADGRSNEQIGLVCGIYTLTGSVSGWTEEQIVDDNTTMFRAMPDGTVLYWYGNISSQLGGFECKLTQSGYTIKSGTVNTNNLYVSNPTYRQCACLNSKNTIDISSFSTCHIISNCGSSGDDIGNGSAFWFHKDLSHAWSFDQGAFVKGMNDNEIQQYDCDITDYNYAAYVGFATADITTRYGYLYAIWLE